MDEKKRTSDRPELFTIAQAANRLTVSVRTLQGLIARGDLTTVRVSARRLAILAQDLENFISSRRRGA